MDGLGSINWWGFTPALDLLQVMDGDEPHGSDCPGVSKGELHILLIGAGDCRHIFKTLAHSYRHSARKLHFYVMESSLELYARHILFLNIILQPQHQLGLQDKTELFLELHGNSLVRQQSMEYVQHVAPEFIKMVTNEDYLLKNFPLIDLSLLKFKERDFLEGIFKFWQSATFNQFDICKCWDLRLRQYLGARFDAIPNVFDWDFHMKLCEKEAAIINGRNYSRWRHKGIAYELREGTYDVPNRTLASGMVFKHEGERLARRGYWGDIIVSPYIAFGIESENTSFFKKSNNMYTQTSEDVAQFNVMSMMYEVAYQSHYQPIADTPLDNKESANATDERSSSNTEGTDSKVETQNNDTLNGELNGTNGTENGMKNTSTCNDDSSMGTEIEVKNNGIDSESRTDNTDKNNGAGDEFIANNNDTDKEGSSVLAEVDARSENCSAQNESCDKKPSTTEDIVSCGLSTVENAKVRFLSLNSTAELIKKSKFHHLFNVVYISNSHAHLLTQDLTDATFANGATVIMDTARFLIELKAEQSSEYVKKVVDIGESVGCSKVIGNIDEKNDSFIKFVYNRTLAPCS